MDRATIGVVFVAVAPGLLAASLLNLRARSLATWAAIPGLSLACVFVLGEAVELLHLPFGLPAFAGLLAILSAATWAKRARRLKNRRTEPESDSTFGSARHASLTGPHLLLAAGIAFGLLTWIGGIHGTPPVPPGMDAANHGFMVGRILYGHTVDPAKVVTTDAAGRHRAVNFYPLGLHASAAIAAKVASANVARVLTAFTILFGAVVLPLGMFVLARQLAPDEPLVAGFTALTVPAILLFPYAPMLGGDVPLIVGTALVPVTVAYLVGGLRLVSFRSKRLLSAIDIAAALLVLTAVAVHSSQMPLILLLVILVVLERAWHRRDASSVWTALARIGFICAVALIMYAPTFGEFITGATERSGINALGTVSKPLFLPAVRATLSLRAGNSIAEQTALALLGAAGAVLCLIRHRLAWPVGWLIVVALTVAASVTQSSVVRLLTFPWYHGALRIDYNQALFVPFFVGVTLSRLVTWGVRSLHRARARPLLSAAVAVSFLGVVGVDAYTSNRTFVHDAMRTPDAGTTPPRLLPFVGNEARVDAIDEDAFRWLRRHVPSTDTVVNEPDVSLWMYAYEHVKPLLAMTPFRRPTSNDYQERRYLAAHVGRAGDDGAVDKLIARYHAPWIFYDAHTFPLGRHIMQLSALQTNPRLSLVFHRNHVFIFHYDAVPP